MSLRDKIMNLPHGATGELYAERAEFLAYKTGHRDARHAAAELAAGQDAVVEQLVDSLEQAVEWLKVSGLSNEMPVMQNARAALAAARGER